MHVVLINKFSERFYQICIIYAGMDVYMLMETMATALYCQILYTMLNVIYEILTAKCM